MDSTEKMMADIKDIALTLQTNTAEQGTTLLKTDENMTVVQDNTDEAHKEIESAEKHQKSSNKWLTYILVTLLIVSLIIIIVVICT